MFAWVWGFCFVLFCFPGNAEEMQRVCSVSGPCPRHFVQPLAHPGPSRRGRGQPRAGGHPRVRLIFTGRSRTAPAQPCPSLGRGRLSWTPTPSPRGTIPTVGPAGAPPPPDCREASGSEGQGRCRGPGPAEEGRDSPKSLSELARPRSLGGAG